MGFFGQSFSGSRRDGLLYTRPRPRDHQQGPWNEQAWLSWDYIAREILDPWRAQIWTAGSEPPTGPSTGRCLSLGFLNFCSFVFSRFVSCLLHLPSFSPQHRIHSSPLQLQWCRVSRMRLRPRKVKVSWGLGYNATGVPTSPWECHSGCSTRTQKDLSGVY